MCLQWCASGTGACTSVCTCDERVWQQPCLDKLLLRCANTNVFNSESNKPWQEQWHLRAGCFLWISLSLSALCQIRNAWVAFTINKTKTTQVTGSALISVTWESSGGDFSLLSCIFRGDFFQSTFNYDYWGNIPPSRPNVLFNLSLLLLLVVAVIKTCRKTVENQTGHYVLTSYTLQWTMAIYELMALVQRNFWIWREEKKKNKKEEKNYYPKTCSIMSETLFPQPNLYKCLA